MVVFDTSPFVNAHGKRPQGFGCWAFGTKPNTDLDRVFFATGTLTDAKKQARDHFDRHGCVRVFVQS